MREILFKAKRIDNGEWVEGCCTECSGKTFVGIDISIGIDIFEVFCTPLIRWIEVDPETLCQFTGLCDKNGNKIWENDICDRKEKYPEVVKMTNGDWTLDYSYAIERDYGNSYCNLGFYVNERKCVEVIGNIFDNPELLQEESNE